MSRGFLGFVLLSVVIGTSTALEMGTTGPATAVFYLYSDANTQATPLASISGPGVPQTVAGGWTASIPGATWIWGSSGTEVLFSNWFSLNGQVTSAILNMAGDDNVQTIVNGNLVPACSGNSMWTSSAQITCDVTALLDTGANSLQFYVINTGGPAGLLFKLTVKIAF
jgi:hypothetical protein